jgi:hypothetical protein
LSPQFLIDGGIVLGTQLLLEEREQNGDDNSGLYRFTKDNEEDGDGENIRHGDSKGLNRVSEGRFGLERLQSLCSCSSCLCEVSKMAELERCGISDSDLIRWWKKI